jgi:hypothetical protein
VRGTLRSVWEYLVVDLWEQLASFESNEASAPTSLFSDLYLAAEEYLLPRPTLASREEASNDPERARELFMSLRGTDFASESDIVFYLEAVHGVIADYEIDSYADRYVQLVEQVLDKYNLRYRVVEPFALRFLLPGSFANLYEELRRHHAANSHLSSLLLEFEQAFDRYIRTESVENLKTCISKASIYTEGVAGVAQKSSGTLGELCDKLQVWPHKTVGKSLKDIYGFCSDYPGIRHAGSPGGALRELEARDLTLASLLFLSFSGYLSGEVDAGAVLGV